MLLAIYFISLMNILEFGSAFKFKLFETIFQVLFGCKQLQNIFVIEKLIAVETFA